MGRPVTRERAWIALLSLAAIVAGACTQSPQSGASPAASAMACPQAQRAPTFSLAPATTRSLELVRLKGSQKYVVRDITDILNVTTVSTLDNTGSAWRFASPDAISYFDDRRIVRMPIAGTPKAAVACVAVSALAWNPTGTAAAYVTRADSAGNSQLHIVSGGQDRVADSMTGSSITDCVAYDCPERISVDLSYSPDGAYISYVQSRGGPVFRLWTADGKLIKSIDAGGAGAGQATFPGMSVWSGGRLYWRDAQGVEVWYDGQPHLLMPGVAWIAPRSSPTSPFITFMTRDNARVAHIRFFNTATGELRELGAWRSHPAFLNAHLIWYQEERPCVAADPDPCPGSVVIPSGRTYIYDLVDSTETESVVQAVFDIWPHPA